MKIYLTFLIKRQHKTKLFKKINISPYGTMYVILINQLSFYYVETLAQLVEFELSQIVSSMFAHCDWKALIVSMRAIRILILFFPVTFLIDGTKLRAK